MADSNPLVALAREQGYLEGPELHGQSSAHRFLCLGSQVLWAESVECEVQCGQLPGTAPVPTTQF